MKEFTCKASEIYAESKPLFYRLLPACILDFEEGNASFNVDMAEAAKSQTRPKRRKLLVMVLTYCSPEQLDSFREWLTDYFSVSMQRDIFELTVGYDGKFKLEEMLQKTLNKYRKV